MSFHQPFSAVEPVDQAPPSPQQSSAPQVSPQTHPPSAGRQLFVPNPKLKLLDQCREVLRFHHYAKRTEETYVDWIRRYVVFHRGPSPQPSRV
jgi:hypothetical protein